MDPESCLERAQDAVAERDWLEARSALDDYRKWRRSGGYQPFPEGYPGDTIAAEIQGCIPAPLTRPEGWTDTTTGGGCTAWRLDLGDREALITLDAKIPEYDSDEIVVAIYRKVDGAGGGSEPIDYHEGTLASCLAWFAEHKDDGKSIDLSGFRMADGSLAQYTSLGSYTILYCGPDKDGTPVYCAKCAAHNQIASASTFDEGEPETCDDCGKEIESSYGPADE